jgi:2-haloacid dehalogenase
MAQKSVVFDLGNVLIRWDPKRLFRTLFSDDAEIDRFLRETAFPHWNEKLDAGVRFDELVPELKRTFPQYTHAIEAYRDRWEETLVGALDETVHILRALHAEGVPLYALTNWSGETFPYALRRFEFLQLFRGILVSGDEKLIKPDPRIYELLLTKFELRATDLFFTDDVEANCQGARLVGLRAHRFQGADGLQKELEGFLGRRLTLDKTQRP